MKNFQPNFSVAHIAFVRLNHPFECVRFASAQFPCSNSKNLFDFEGILNFNSLVENRVARLSSRLRLKRSLYFYIYSLYFLPLLTHSLICLFHYQIHLIHCLIRFFFAYCNNADQTVIISFCFINVILKLNLKRFQKVNYTFNYVFSNFFPGLPLNIRTS